MKIIITTLLATFIVMNTAFAYDSEFLANERRIDNEKAELHLKQELAAAIRRGDFADKEGLKRLNQLQFSINQTINNTTNNGE